jgi:hypothetical protein
MQLVRCNYCGTEVVADIDWRGAKWYGFIEVDTNSGEVRADLCSWDCLAPWAANKASENSS